MPDVDASPTEIVSLLQGRILDAIIQASKWEGEGLGTRDYMMTFALDSEDVFDLFQILLELPIEGPK